MAFCVTGVLLIFNTLPLGNARGQEATSENSIETPETITPDQAARAFERVRTFIRDGRDGGTPEVRPTVANLSIYLGGERLSEERVMFTDDPVGEAMVRAYRNAKRALGDRFDARTTPGALTIQLEMGGAWTPRSAPDWAALGVFSKPGVHGVAARVGTGGNERVGALLPSTQMRYGLGPLGVWRRVCAEIGVPLGILGDVVKATGVRFYTFDVTRVMQRDGASAFAFPHRSGRVVPLASITTPGLHDAADSMARFLIAQRWTGLRALGMRGDLNLASGQRNPEVAPIREQLAAAFALARFARTEGVDPDPAARARAASTRILEEALLVEPGEELFSQDPVAAAVFLIASAELSRSGPLPAELEGALSSTRRLVMEFGANPAGARVEAGVAALVALALIRDTNDLNGPDDHRAAGVTVARALLVELGARDAHTAMPWLGLALIESSRGKEHIAGDLALESFREQTERLQANDLLLDLADRDLAGGFLWGEDPGAYPDWRSAHLGAVLGRMLGDARLTPADERVARLDRVRRAARFVLQLRVEGDQLWNSPAGTMALGGVRRSVWDDEVAIDTTSMALLSLCETIDGVRQAFGN